MANLKQIESAAYVSGLTVYGIIRRMSDNYYFDYSDGAFRATPVSAYFPMTEDLFMQGTYILQESRTVWLDGEYLVRSYKRIGATPNTAIDQGIGFGNFWIDNDDIAELESTITSLAPVVIQAPPATTAYAASDIIIGALQLLGLGRAENFDSVNDIAKNLTILNQVMAKLLVSGQLAQQTVDEGFALTAGIATYTIGLGLSAASDHFVTSRPVRIESAYIVDSTNTHYPVEIISRDQMDTIADQELSLARPTFLFYDIGITQQISAVGTIHLYTEPDSSSTYTLHINSVKELTSFNQSTDPVTFSMEYMDYLETALAIRLAPLYGVAVSPELREQHRENEDIIETLSWRKPTTRPNKIQGNVLMNIYTSQLNQ